MKMAQTIRVIMAKKDIRSESELARKIGWSPQNLHNKMSRDNFSTSELSEIAVALGCTLAIQFVDDSTGEPIL